MINPIANPDQFAAEADVVAMWKDERIHQARDVVKMMYQRAYGDRRPAEALPAFDQSVDEYVTNWMFKAVASDTQHPRFVRDFMKAYHWHGHDVPGSRTGGDNPDNCYRLAGIGHGTAYRITGKVIGKQPANVTFTLTANYGTSVTIQTIDDHLLERAADGSFVITVDDQPANGRPNHMTTAPHVKFMYVRDSMSDWSTETPFDLAIERLGEAKAPPLTLDQMIEAAAFRMKEDVPLYFWFHSLSLNRTINTMTPASGPKGLGGLVTQSMSHAMFDLDEDQGVIVEYEPAGARYVAVQLTDWYFRSLDYGEIQSSLTRDQSAIDSDGRIRVVIARRDPGVANWIDTGGLAVVLLIMRWQGRPSIEVRGGPWCQMKLVKLADLTTELPADTTWFTAEQRKAQLDQRHADFARRF